MEDSQMAFQKIQHKSRHNGRPRPGNAAVTTHTAEEARRCRDAQLQKLLPLWPHEIADRSFNGVARIVALLARALRSERQRGKAGHWTYDLSRHLALVNALRRERAELRRLAAQPKARPTRVLSIGL
jgi:hypothetical protein